MSYILLGKLSAGDILEPVVEGTVDGIEESINKFWLLSRIFKDLNFASILSGLITITVILIVSTLFVKLSRKVIAKFFNKNKKMKKFGLKERKADTLSLIVQSIVKYFIYFIAAIMILQQIGIETSSIIATAGIGGVAIGFGAKSLVEDVITGFFILFEDQYSIGEHIQIDEFEGIVEDMQLRVTKIRAFNGELHIIPNGNISIVTNKSRGSIRADVDLRIPYDSDTKKVFSVLESVSNKMKEEYKESITVGPIINGIAEFTTQDMRVNMYAMTKPSCQYSVAYAMRRMAIEELEKNGIDVRKLKSFSLNTNYIDSSSN